MSHRNHLYMARHAGGADGPLLPAEPRKPSRSPIPSRTGRRPCRAGAGNGPRRDAGKTVTFSPLHPTELASVHPAGTSWRTEDDLAKARAKRRNRPANRAAAVALGICTAVLCAAVAAACAGGWIDSNESLLRAIGLTEGGSSIAEGPVSDDAETWEKGSVPILYQNDAAWSHAPYGSSTAGSVGDAALCLCMARASITGDTACDPAAILAYAHENRLDDPTKPELMLIDGATGLGLSATAVDKTELALRREILAGRPVIAVVSGGVFPSQRTCIVIVGIDEYGKLEIHDPSSEKRTAEHLGFSAILDQTDSLYAYRAA